MDRELQFDALGRLVAAKQARARLAPMAVTLAQSDDCKKRGLPAEQLGHR